METMNHLSEELKKSMIEMLNTGDKDKPYLVHKKKSYTKSDIQNEIANETEFGIEMMKNVVKLTIDLVSRNKKKIDGIDIIIE
jgi:hypothetical protein